MPGWPELHFYGEAKTDTGNIWWYEDRQEDGSILKRPLMPYKAKAR